MSGEREGGAVARDTSPEQRVHPRKELELPVVVSDSASRVGGTLCFDTCDLSVGGAFLRSDLLFELHEELDLHLDLPGGGHVVARGRVVRVVREPSEGTVAGMGIAFTEFAERDRDAVRAFLARA